MKNTIQEKIQEQLDNDKERLAENYRELYDLLDVLEIARENKVRIGEIVEKIAYCSERQGLQQGVSRVNQALSNLYWSTHPSFSVNYWQHEQVKKYEEANS